MELLQFRKGTEGDLDRVEGIYQAIFRSYASGAPNYTNWKEGLYPLRSDAEATLAAGTLYVAQWAGQVAACVSLNHVQPPEYAKVAWSCEAEGDEVLVVHTLCVHPDFRGKGIARSFVEFAQELAREMGCKAIRLDTYKGNVPATALYRSMGFADQGLEEFLCHGQVSEQWRCFDKVL